MVGANHLSRLKAFTSACDRVTTIANRLASLRAAYDGHLKKLAIELAAAEAAQREAKEALDAAVAEHE